MLVLFIYITRLASNEIFSPSNKIHGARNLSAPRYVLYNSSEIFLILGTERDMVRNVYWSPRPSSRHSCQTVMQLQTVMKLQLSRQFGKRFNIKFHANASSGARAFFIRAGRRTDRQTCPSCCFSQSRERAWTFITMLLTFPYLLLVPSNGTAVVTFSSADWLDSCPQNVCDYLLMPIAQLTPTALPNHALQTLFPPFVT